MSMYLSLKVPSHTSNHMYIFSYLPFEPISNLVFSRAFSQQLLLYIVPKHVTVSRMDRYLYLYV